MYISLLDNWLDLLLIVCVAISAALLISKGMKSKTYFTAFSVTLISYLIVFCFSNTISSSGKEFAVYLSDEHLDEVVLQEKPGRYWGLYNAAYFSKEEFKFCKKSLKYPDLKYQKDTFEPYKLKVCDVYYFDTKFIDSRDTLDSMRVVGNLYFSREPLVFLNLFAYKNSKEVLSGFYGNVSYWRPYVKFKEVERVKELIEKP